MSYLYKIVILCLLYPSLNAQTVDFSGAQKGLVIPVVDTAGLTGLVKGTIIYYTADSCIYLFNGIKLNKLALSNQIDEISDKDNDTKIQVEESADEDIIRFDLEGDERYVFFENRMLVDGEFGSTFIGDVAGQNSTNSIDNTIIGANSGGDLTTGRANTVVGSYAGLKMTTGLGNTYVGFRAGVDNKTSDDNTFIGNNAGVSHVSGEDNVAVGVAAMQGDTSGMRNTAVGASSLSFNESGRYNTALGFSSLRQNLTGSDNTGIGINALQNLTTGSNNIALGAFAGRNVINGSYNVFIGSGAGLTDTGSYKLYIESNAGGTDPPLIYGNFNADSLITNSTYVVNGKTVFNPDSTNRNIVIDYKEDGPNFEPFIHPSHSNWGYLGDDSLYFYKTYSNFYFAMASGNYQTFSDLRLKRDIEDLTDASTTLNQLRPVTYYLKSHRSNIKNNQQKLNYGLIAQEVQKVIPQIVEQSSNGNLSIGYQALIPILIKALQEQDAQIHVLEDKLDGQNELFTATLERLNAEMNSIQQQFNSSGNK